MKRWPQCPHVRQTLQDLALCRTPALGGHVTQCDHCGEVRYHYHSCGNRSCPQCGGSKRAAWLAKCQANLLPVPYFHVVFTLPHELSALALGNRELLYRLLFDSAKETLLEVAADPKHLGARIGVLMVLHTWGQKLEHHPHVHCVVPGGGLAIPAKSSGSTATVPGDQVPRLGVLPAQLVLAGPSAGPSLPRQVPGSLAHRLPSRPTPVRWEHLAPGEPGGVGDLDKGVVPEGLGGLCQGALWGAGTGTEILDWVHAPGRLEQSPSGQAPGRSGHLHLEGLRRQLPAQGDDAGGGGIRAPVRAAHHTQRVGTDSAVWTFGSPRSRGAVGVVPVAVGGRRRTGTGTRDRLAAAECQCRIDGQRPVTEWGGTSVVSGRAQVGSAISDGYLHPGGLGFAPGRIGGHDLVRLIPGCAASRGSGRRSLPGLWRGSPTNDLASRPTRPDRTPTHCHSGQFMNPVHPKRRLLLNRHPRRPGPATDAPCGVSAVIGHPLSIVTIGSIPAIFISASDPWPVDLVAASGCYPRVSVHIGSTC